MPVDARALTLHRPRSLKTALAMLAKEPTLTPIAGCTDVFVGLHFETSRHKQFASCLAAGGSVARAQALLREEIAPIDDVRSTREYRSQVAANLLGQFWKETNG